MKPLDSDEEDAEQLGAYQKELRRKFGQFNDINTRLFMQELADNSQVTCYTEDWNNLSNNATFTGVVSYLMNRVLLVIYR